MAKQIPFALITGCSSGIGKQLAITFADRGVTVLATARHVKHLEDLTSQHDNIEAFPLDLSSPSSIETLKDAIVTRTGGRLDFLVNNAGTHYAATALDLEVEEAVKLFQVNVFAVMRLCQLFVPLLRRSQCGRIVQIGSVTRDVPVVWQSAYNASKAALSQYTKTIRLELKPFNVEVIEVVTGFVRSNILHHGLFAPDDSLYLPIKSTIEAIKYEGNKNGMPAENYAASVVDKVMRQRVDSEIWQGSLSWYIYFIVTFLPLYLLNWLLFRKSNLRLLNESLAR
ncbi:hypothetical protein N7478_010007 [Penicillium angulare]|uniref:uncharacterized protein n=1 Tax=Penicillium angulare TaxID=116970 RepID=UPI0025407BCE|nr:uncharacterized protein N7478_010007 [Penicillium angulare]KAJ5267199.1 hypothetical protein N7478_010007 [Penicillium angulare]